MKTIFLSTLILLASLSTFAEDKTAAKAKEQNQDYAQMHEKMAQAHQQTAECLKSGKPVEECRKNFHDMCKEAGSPGQCGSWMMHHKMMQKPNK